MSKKGDTYTNSVYKIAFSVYNYNDIGDQPNDTIRYIMMFTDGVGSDMGFFEQDLNGNGVQDFIEESAQKVQYIIHK